MRLWLLTSVAALGAALTWFAVWRAAARVLPDRVPDPADAPKPPPVSPLEAAGLALALALALARTLPLMSRGFSYDEIWSVTDFFGTPSLWHAVSTFAEYNNHVFYSVLAWGAARVLGPAEWAYRAPALLFGVASIVALWWFARPRLGPAGGVLAALLLGTSPVAVAMSATARGYTGMVFFSLVATAAFFRLFHPAAGRGTGAAWLLATFLGIYTHLMAGTVLAVQVLMLGVVAWRQRGAPASAPLLSTARFDRIWKLMGCVGVLTAVAYLPVWRSLAGTLVSGEPSALVPSFPMDVVAFLAGTERGVSWPAVLLGLTAGYGLTAGWRSGFLERTTVQLLFLLPVLGLWLARPEYVRTRFLLFLLPFFIVGVVTGVMDMLGQLRAAGSGARGVAVRIAGLTFVTAIALGWGLRTPQIPSGGFREAALAMQDDLEPGIGLCAVGFGARFLAYYTAVPVLVPGSEAEFDQFARQHREVRCAHWRGSSPPHHAAIVDRLAAQGPPQQYFFVHVYRYRARGAER